MEDFIVSTVIIADSPTKPSNREEAKKMWRDHVVFMVYILPVLLLLLVTISEGWNWWFFGGMTTYAVVIRWLFKTTDRR